MKAVIVHKFADFRFEETSVPSIRGGDLLMKVAYSGICGSDRAIYLNKAPWDLSFPFIPGHEFIGVIEELGPDAKKRNAYKVGDKITAELIIPCRKCFFCRTGRYNLCNNPRFLGSSLNGGWAEYMRIPEEATIYKIPDNVSLKEGAIVEPLSCSLWAVERAGISFKDTVLISGLGPIGIGAVMGAKLKSPKTLIAADIDEKTFSLAKQAGADHVVNAADPGFGEKIESITEGLGPSIVIEASGSVAALKSSIKVIQKGGRLIVYGVYGTDAPVNWSQISEFKELTVIGGHLAPNMFPVCLSLLSKKQLDPLILITHEKPLEDFKEGLELRENSAEPVIKVLLKP